MPTTSCGGYEEKHRRCGRKFLAITGSSLRDSILQETPCRRNKSLWRTARRRRLAQDAMVERRSKRKDSAARRAAEKISARALTPGGSEAKDTFDVTQTHFALHFLSLLEPQHLA